MATCFYTRQVDYVPCVFAEYVEGGSLAEWISSRRIYAGEEAAVVARIIRIATSMAWGLDGAHQVGLIHCDMKPANVLMSTDAMAKITDFGLAKAIDGKGGSTLEGWMSKPWASPEQARQQPLTSATDVWSWAVSVLEIFMGGVQWQSGPVAAAALEEFTERGGKAVGIPAMPASISKLLTRCLQSRPTDRPRFEEIAEELRTTYEDEFGEPCEAEKPDLELLAADSLNNRAVSLIEIGRAADAEVLFREALAADPHHPEATFNLASIHSSHTEDNEYWAVQNLHTAADMEVGNPVPLKLLAQLYLRIGRPQDAKRCFAQAAKRAWTAAGKEEIEEMQRGSETDSLKSVLARPRSGSDFSADLSRFRRLLRKTEISLADDRREDANRYARLAADIQGFARHPRLRRVLTQLRT